MPPAPGCQWGPSRARAIQKAPASLSAVGRAEQGRVFDPGIDRVRIAERRFQMPDALELPGMRRAVVPLVSAGNPVVDEFVIHRLPRFAAIVGPSNQLTEPAAGLGCIEPIRVDRRSLEMIISHPPKKGPLMSHCSRLPSADRMKRPCACQPVPSPCSSATPFLSFPR